MKRRNEIWQKWYDKHFKPKHDWKEKAVLTTPGEFLKEAHEAKRKEDHEM